MKIIQVNSVKDALVKSVTNKSGGNLVEGDVVVWSGAADNSVTTTELQSNPLFAGIVLVGGADGAIISIITHGYAAKVLTDQPDGHIICDWLSTIDTPKKAHGWVGTSDGHFGVALTDADANGYVSAIIGLQAENY